MDTIKVIYSPGFGAGVWGLEDKYRTDAEAVALVEQGRESEAMQRLASLLPDPSVLYIGSQQLAIAEVPVGSYWRIHEYDGFEIVDEFIPDEWQLA
jgi:hypothetical protein